MYLYVVEVDWVEELKPSEECIGKAVEILFYFLAVFLFWRRQVGSSFGAEGRAEGCRTWQGAADSGTLRQVDIMFVMSIVAMGARLRQGFGGPCHDNVALSDMPSVAICRKEARP